MRYFRAESRSGLDSTQEVFEKLPGKSLENLASPTGFELQTIKNVDDAEEIEVIDVSRLKKAGG